MNIKLKIFTLSILFGFLSFQTKAKTYYVSESGNDEFSGAKEKPYRTINKGAAMAIAGDTVYVMAGVYRERVAPPRSGLPEKPIVFFGEPGKNVFIKGSEIWEPKWESDGNGNWYAIPEDYLFTDRSLEYKDHYNPFKVELASTPYQRQGKFEKMRGWGGDTTLVYSCGQVIVDNEMFIEVPFKKELQSGHWHYEEETGRIYVNFGDTSPNKHQVEITTRQRIFAPFVRELGHITVEGFIMEHAGTNYPTNFWVKDGWAQKGALGLEAGHHWIVRKNVIRRAKTFAIDCGNVDWQGRKEGLVSHNNLIEDNYILENGAAGIMSNASLDLVIRGNVVMYNNTLGFLGMKRWEQAGIKCHDAKNGVIEKNYVAHNYLTFGIWFDNKFPDARITRNVLAFNGRCGIFFEMSDYDFDRCFVDNNIILGNATNQVYMHDASGVTFMHNLMAFTEEQPEYGQAVFLRQTDSRTRTYHHSFYNNMFIDNAMIYNLNYPSHRGGPQKLDYNVYAAGSKDRLFGISKLTDRPSPYTDEEFRSVIKKDLGKMAPPEIKMSGTHLNDVPDSMCGNHRQSEEEINSPKGMAHLTLAEWQVFWKSHELNNDKHSVMSNRTTMSYNPKTHELLFNIAFNPGTVGSQNHKFVDDDFFGNYIPQNGKALPGPFQTLKKGKNSFVIWEGLDILEIGELPDPNIFK